MSIILKSPIVGAPVLQQRLAHDVEVKYLEDPVDVNWGLYEYLHEFEQPDHRMVGASVVVIKNLNDFDHKIIDEEAADEQEHAEES